MLKDLECHLSVGDCVKALEERTAKLSSFVICC